MNEIRLSVSTVQCQQMVPFDLQGY